MKGAVSEHLFPCQLTELVSIGCLLPLSSLRNSSCPCSLPLQLVGWLPGSLYVVHLPLSEPTVLHLA